MNKEDKKLQKHLVDEMMKVSKTNPDVMIYMQALMENYEKLEQEIDRLNNILNELENMLSIKYIRATNEKDYDIENDDIKELLDKLKELKEDK